MDFWERREVMECGYRKLRGFKRKNLCVAHIEDEDYFQRAYIRAWSEGEEFYQEPLVL